MVDPFDPDEYIEAAGINSHELGFIITVKDTPPKEKVTDLDIPGMNGVLRISKALTGDVVFGNRQHEIVMVNEDPNLDFEAVKSLLLGRWGGQELDYRLSRDPDYKYHGRFTISSFDEEEACTVILTIDADPYKKKEDQVFRVDAAGGVVVTLSSGRRPVCPTFEFASETIVSNGDVYARMQPGSYRVNDLWLHEGTNEIYLNSYLGCGNVPASDYGGSLIVDYARNRVSDLIWEGIRMGALLISDMNLDNIGMHANERIIDSEFGVSADSERYAVYIEYGWSDL